MSTRESAQNTQPFVCLERAIKSNAIGLGAIALHEPGTAATLPPAWALGSQ